MIIKSLLCIEELQKVNLKKTKVDRNNCYELFGYDIMLDNNLKPWLIEINLSPSLASDSPLDLKIKGNLLKDTFNLAGFKFPNAERDASQNKRPGLMKKADPLKSQLAKLIEELST